MWLTNMFHVQVLLLEILLCRQAEKRSMFWLRLVPLGALFLALPYLIPDGFFAPIFMVGWFTLGFPAFTVLSGLLIAFCYHIQWQQAVFYCCIAHTLQHFIHRLNRALSMLLGMSPLVEQLTQTLFLGVACLFVYRWLQRRMSESDELDFKNGYKMLFAVVSSLMVYGLSFWAVSSEGDTICLDLFDALSSALLMYILLDVFRLRKAEQDQRIMQQLLQKEQEQHQMSRSTVEVINRKCHDLRHQIEALRHMSDEDKEKSLEELEHAVMIYDRFPKSGNKDLDIILAEKSLLAEQRGISIRYMVDGSKLTFIRMEDLFSLLGNALDNAIEATGQEPDPEKRIISLTSSIKGNLLQLHIDNPCATCPAFADGMPLTSKADPNWHGFGVRSMNFLCEKYGGALTTSWEDGVFAVDMVFPLLPDTDEK